MHEDEGSENVKEKSEPFGEVRKCLRSLSMFKKDLEENGKLVVVCLLPP